MRGREIVSSSTASDAIKIGVTLPRSGRYARSAGVTYDNTYRFWVDQVNAVGGILGKPVELVVYDDGSTPQQAAELYQRPPPIPGERPARCHDAAVPMG